MENAFSVSLDFIMMMLNIDVLPYKIGVTNSIIQKNIAKNVSVDILLLMETAS